MTALCPTCGTDLERDIVIDRDGLHLDPRTTEVRWQDKPVHLNRGEFTVLYALVKAAPHLVTQNALAERLGYEGDLVKQNVHQRVTHIRKALPGSPICTLWGRGFAWLPERLLNERAA